MKKLLTLIIMVLAVAIAMAQAPENFSFQAVVRNANNSLVANAQVGVRVNILQGSATGDAVYSESHVMSTNANGLVTVSIGGGSVLHGSFAGINWADGPYFLKTDIDPNGGNDYSITSVQQLLSVPYALYAKEAGNGFSGDYNDLTNTPAIPTVPTNVSAFANDAGYITMDSVPAIPTVPTNVSAFTNDAGYLTGYTETDPQFNAWDKDYNDLTNKPTLFSGNYNDLTNKPTLFDGNYNSLSNKPNLSAVALSGSYNDLLNKPSIPTAVGELSNNVGYITAAQVPAQVNADWNATSGAAQILNKPTLFSGNYNDLTNKPVLFSGDYNDLTNLPQIPQIPADVSAFNNDAGYLTSYTETDPQFNAWDKDYNDLINLPQIPQIPADVSAFNNDAGYITAQDIPAIPTVPTDVSAFNNDAGYLTSYTEQQVLSISNDTLFLTGGSFVKLPAGFDGDYNSLTNKPVLFSGNYNDLTNLPQIPQIPADVSAFNNDAGYLTDYTETDPQFSAWDKDYNDLTNKPVIPAAANNATLTIQRNGSSVGTFTADASSNKTINIAVPTSTSELTNNSGFITAGDLPAVPENVSAFTNDAGYITNSGSNCDNTVNLCELMDRLAQLENMLNVLTVRTAGVTAVTENTFTVEGEVVNDGGATVTQRGFVYATTHNPTISNNRRNVGSGTGSFSTTITSLTAGTTYYVRAFATNVNGTVYGSEVAVTTTATTPTTDTPVDAQPCPGTPTVTDHEGNVYHTVQIGEQCWMAENLRTTTSPSTGTYLIPPAGTTYTNSGKQARWYNDDSVRYAPLGCGLLYNWNAAVDTFNAQYGENSVSTDYRNAVSVTFTGHRRGICPQGWHLPSDAEWTALTQYVSSVPAYRSEYDTYHDSTRIAKVLASDTLWNNSTTTCAVGNNQSSNNATGFGALPTGGYGYSGSYGDFGRSAYFWSATQSNSYTAYRRGLYFNDAVVYRYNSYKVGGFSVRCLRDNAVTDGETPVQPDTTLNPPADTTVTNGTPCPGAPTVTDHEGNMYATVQIGEQCWMAENLRTTTSPSTGTYLIPPAGTTYTYTGKQARWYNNDSVRYAPLGCGLLYNWNAAVDTFNTQYGENSVSTDYRNAVSVTFTGHRRGICPQGWHLPSDAEWTALTQYVSSVPAYRSEYDTYHDSTRIAKALASDTLWNNSTTTCAVGNNQSSNNATGFGALPTGYYTGSYYSFGNNAHFWSATLVNSGNAYGRGLYYTSADVDRDYNGKTSGFSVRCLRDNAVTDGETPVQSDTTMNPPADTTVTNGTPCPGAPIVTDHEGNVYHTVKIGDQCWTKENLRTTTSPTTGTYLIPAAGTGYTYTGKQARWYNNDSATYAPMNYGLLYNWNAAADTFNVAYGEISVNTDNSNAVSVSFTGHRRGICPAGWHLPSDAEWTQLTNYVSSQSEYTCDSNSNYIAKALASTEGWNTSTNNCVVGNDPSTNNATGFSAVPAGFCSGSLFYGAGGNAYFCSSTQGDRSYAAYTRYLGFNFANVRRLNDAKFNGRSVRCLRDSGGGDGSSATLPTVTTNTVSNITPTAATSGGNIIADGGASVTARGVCWSTSQNPTVNGSHTADGSGMGSFSSSISGLTANTTYYVRAYATNSAGTAYGNEVSFTTLSTAVIDSKSCPGTPTVTDHEGNVYATVQIGNQCWMRDNLRTTTSPSTGTYLISAANANYTFTGKQARWFNNDSATYAPMNYGLLYNWNAAVDTFNTTYGETSVNTSFSNAVSVTFNGHRRGICPAGWHLPSDAEWTTLTDYVSSQSEFQCGGNSNYIAKALAFTEGWNTYTNNCVVGNDPSTNNATGFSAVPAGLCNGSSFSNAGLGAYFWSSPQHISTNAYYRSLVYGSASVNRSSGYKNDGRSVRCLRDSGGSDGSSTLPTVITNTVSNITPTTATCGGNITSDGGASVTARGVCWSTSQNPTVNGSHTADGSGMGSFSSSISGLTANTTYYVRAYATNSAGTAYGETVAFTTLSAGGTAIIDAKSCPAAPTVTDHEGNVYATVQIGNQCWTRDNLRTTTSPTTGTYLIPAAGTGYTYTGKQAFWYNNDSATYAPMNYGLLYNWNAAADTFNAAYGEISVNTDNSNAVSVSFTGHRRGICPAGWHLPSDAEWTQLENYVGSQSEYTCGGDSSNIAKALASTEGWNISTYNCAVGNALSGNNATGFSAVPAGLCHGSSFNNAGLNAHFWSSAQYNSGYAYYRNLYYGYANVGRHYFYKLLGRSVRCLRD